MTLENITNAENNADVLISLTGTGDEPVSVRTAMQIPMINRCVTMIAGAVAMLPIRLYRKTADGVEEITSDRRLDILNRDTGDTMNADYMRYAWVRDLMLTGSAYSYIEHANGRPYKLYYISSEDVGRMTNRYDPLNKTYQYTIGTHIIEPWQMLKILRNTDGYGGGKGILDENTEVISTAYALIRYQKKQISNGGAKRGILKTNGMKKDIIAEIKNKWAALWGSKRDSDSMFIINAPDVDFKELSSTSVDMQLNQTQETIDKELMKLFGTNDGLLTDETVKNAVLPVIDIIEAALDSDLLLEREKGTMYFAFDTRELTRGDINQRYSAYATALSQNFMQLDEVRAMEDLPPLGINFIKLGLNDVLLDPATGRIYTPNTNQYATMGESAEIPLTTGDEGGNIETEKRENKNHLPAGTPQGGQFASKEQKALFEALSNGTVSSKVDKDKQAEHKKGSVKYDKRKAKGERPSYTELSNMEVQKIINDNIYNSIVIDCGDGQFKVNIQTENDFGFYDSQNIDSPVPTNRGTIHLSKDGAHLVPSMPQKMIDEKFGSEK